MNVDFDEIFFFDESCFDELVHYWPEGVGARTQTHTHAQISGYDSISRVAMLRGLQQMETGDALLPFVSKFYGFPSTYMWGDDERVVHEITQGEGGEQGDALMPALFSLGQHSALEAIQARLRPGERLMAFLDDIYAKSIPNRFVAVFTAVQEELQRVGIQVHDGKTQLWNRSGVVPTGTEALTEAARTSDPDAIVWRGDVSLPPQERGVKDLGTPMRSPEFVRSTLAAVSAKHDGLISQIVEMLDLQYALILLLH